MNSVYKLLVFIVFGTLTIGTTITSPWRTFSPNQAYAAQAAAWQVVAGPGGLSGPISIAVSPDGSLYVGDTGHPKGSTGSGRVQKLSSSGTRLATWDVQTDGEDLGDPNGLAIDTQGNLWVADYHNGADAIQSYTSTGQPIHLFNQAATGIAVDHSGNLYVTDFYCECLHKLGPNGHVIFSTGKYGTGPGQFGNLQGPTGVALDAAGDIYVADPEGSRIEKFSPSGAFLAVIGHPGTAPGEFDGVSGLAIDPQGNLFVADTANDRIQELSASGQPLEQWGELGSEPGQLHSPIGIALDAQGNVLVADTGNNRIQELHLDGSGTTVTPSPRTPFQTFWTNSLHAEAAVFTVHSSGTIADKTMKVRFAGDCGEHELHIQVSGKNQQGQSVSVDYLNIESKFWARARQGHGGWGAWKQGEGSDADIFIPFVIILCPQASAQEYRNLPVTDVEAVFKDLGSAVIAGSNTRHLKEASTKQRIDLYIDPQTFRWLRVTTRDKTAATTVDAVYSRFNGPLLKAPTP